MDQLPRTEMHTNLIWSGRGNINADSKKGNVEKTIRNSLFSRQTSEDPFAEIHRIHSRKFVRSVRGNPFVQMVHNLKNHKHAHCTKVHNVQRPSSNFSATSGGNSASLGGCKKRFRDQWSGGLQRRPRAHTSLIHGHHPGGDAFKVSQ